MLLPKLLGEISEFKEISRFIRRKVEAIRKLQGGKGRGWVPTSEEEWQEVISTRVPSGYFGIVSTRSSNYLHVNDVLLEMPLTPPSAKRVELPVSDITLLESPTRVSLATDEFMRVFSDALIGTRERAFEELRRRKA